MITANTFDFDDLQGLVRCGHGALNESVFLLLDIKKAKLAKQWLQVAPFTNASSYQEEHALQIAFSVEGLRKLGLNEAHIEQFSDEYIVGMSGDESRSRRLGDIADNEPEKWDWGRNSQQVPHIILMIYARKKNIASWRKTIAGELFSSAFHELSQLPTSNIIDKEPFGFADGISQPKIDWESQQTTDTHHRARYSNLLAKGEVVLGYLNEYGYYTPRPLIDADTDPLASVLPDAEEQPELKDLGRNGTYLVCRQLSQDVPRFWQFVNQQTDNKTRRKQLAEAMVGRKMDKKGTPLIAATEQQIPGIASPGNNFNYDQDQKGTQCPISAHIRRSNPRTGDLPSGSLGLFDRIKKLLGFNEHLEDDLIASTRFHRILRRGRSYGSMITPEQAIKAEVDDEERGLQFICLAANISRQFEFVQNAWAVNSKFGGLQQQGDPLLGHRQALKDGAATDQFHRPDKAGPQQKTCQLPQFVTVRGGGYFFMPGLKALQYLSSLPNKQE